jgi:hypothetical protein
MCRLKMRLVESEYIGVGVVEPDINIEIRSALVATTREFVCIIALADLRVGRIPREVPPP